MVQMSIQWACRHLFIYWQQKDIFELIFFVKCKIESLNEFSNGGNMLLSTNVKSSDRWRGWYWSFLLGKSCEETLNPGIHAGVTLNCIVRRNDDGSLEHSKAGRPETCYTNKSVVMATHRAPCRTLINHSGTAWRGFPEVRSMDAPSQTYRTPLHHGQNKRVLVCQWFVFGWVLQATLRELQ